MEVQNCEYRFLTLKRKKLTAYTVSQYYRGKSFLEKARPPTAKVVAPIPPKIANCGNHLVPSSRKSLILAIGLITDCP